MAAVVEDEERTQVCCFTQMDERPEAICQTVLVSPQTFPNPPLELATAPASFVRQAASGRRGRAGERLVERDEIEAALRDVSDELERRGVNARIDVVGGAAMSLAFDARLSTADVDAAIYPTTDVLDVAHEVALQRGLPENWLNDSAKQFIPAFKEPDWRPVFRVGTVEIATADERAMLAMKMRASRGSRELKTSSSCWAGVTLRASPKLWHSTRSTFRKIHCRAGLDRSCEVLWPKLITIRGATFNERQRQVVEASSLGGAGDGLCDDPPVSLRDRGIGRRCDVCPSAPRCA